MKVSGEIEEIKSIYRSVKPSRHFDDGQYDFLKQEYYNSEDGTSQKNLRRKACLRYCISEFKLILRDMGSKKSNILESMRTEEWYDFESDIVYWRKHIDRVCTRLVELYPDIDILEILQEAENEN